MPHHAALGYLPSPLQVCGKPGGEVGPVSAPEGGETISLPMADFPGRWLETLCFLISFTPSTSQHWTRSGDGWGRSSPPGPWEEGRGLRLWQGRGPPGMAVGNLWPGCSEVTAGFISQVSALCRRGLHQTLLHRSSELPWASCPTAAPGRPGSSRQPWAQWTVLASAVSLDALPPDWHCPSSPLGTAEPPKTTLPLSFFQSPSTNSSSL